MVVKDGDESHGTTSLKKMQDDHTDPHLGSSED